MSYHIGKVTMTTEGPVADAGTAPVSSPLGPYADYLASLNQGAAPAAAAPASPGFSLGPYADYLNSLTSLVTGGAAPAPAGTPAPGKSNTLTYLGLATAAALAGVLIYGRTRRSK